MKTTGNSLYSRIYSLVKQVPAGRVTTYGDIARAVNTTPRVVGFAMAALTVNQDVPWQRVINSKGEVSRRSDGERGDIQRMMLEKEGVRFNEQQHVDLQRLRWHFHAMDIPPVG